MSSSQLVSDSRERDFAAGHAIAELELELAGGDASLLTATEREPLIGELAALDRAFAELAKVMRA